jgi:hypothetical protein
LPSLPDLPDLDLGLGVEPTVTVAPSDVLARVKAEGMRRRSRRHRRNFAVAGVALCALAVPVVSLWPGGDPGTERVDVAATGPDSTSSSPPPP